MLKEQTQVRPTILIAIVITILLVFCAAILPALSPSGKLRGNKFMLYECNNMLRIWKNAKPNSPNFDFSKLSYHDTEFILIWSYGRDVWAKTNFN